MRDHRDSPTPVWVAITDTLRRRIIDGRYPPGARLPSWDDLAAEFGVSRLTARRAVGQLAAEGLAELVPRRGAYVKRDAA